MPWPPAPCRGWWGSCCTPGSSGFWGSLGFDIYVKSPSRIVNLGHQNFVGNVVVLIYDDCKIVFVPYKRMMMTRKLIIWYYMCVQIETKIIEKIKVFQKLLFFRSLKIYLFTLGGWWREGNWSFDIILLYMCAKCKLGPGLDIGWGSIEIVTRGIIKSIKKKEEICFFKRGRVIRSTRSIRSILRFIKKI